MFIDHLDALVYPGSLSRCGTVEVWHFRLYLLVTILRWWRDIHMLGLSCPIVVIVKIVKALFMCRDYRDNVWSSEVLRRSMCRLATRSRLLFVEAKDS
jgi:hypothetical protein